MLALSDRLVGEVLPAFQRAVDAVDAAAVVQAGQEVAVAWSALQGAQAAVVTPDQPEPYEFSLIRQAVLRSVTIQTFRGQAVVQVNRNVDTLGDVGHFIVEQTEAAAATIKDAAELVAVLRADPEPVHAPNDNDEKRILGILTAHPNPWQLGYLRAVVEAYGLKDALENLSIDGRRDLQTIFASQEVILKKETVTAADTVGLLEAVTGERKVRVARPAPLGQIATELYGEARFMEDVLVPYNRFVLKDLPADGLVPAGVELVIDPRLVVERYRPLFKALELARPMMGRPYITASPDGTAVAGAKVKYTLRWPQPEPSDNLADDFITVPLHDVIYYCGVGFTAEFDPGADRKATHDEAHFDPQIAYMPQLAKDGIHVSQTWPVVGNHVLRVTVTPQPDTNQVHDLIGGESIELTYTQTVLSLGEKTQADWLALEDEAKPVQPGDEELKKWADEQGISLEEFKKQNPFIMASRVPGYTPEQLLDGLKRQLDVTPPGKDKDKLQAQIASLERGQERTKSAPMRPLEALYVSDDSGGSTRLLLYVAPDMEAPNSHVVPLRLWDFTLPDEAREYTDDGSAVNPWESLRIALRTFAHDSPYPDGNLRIRIDTQSLPEEFTEHTGIAPEILELRTQGGAWSERWAGRLVMAGLLVIGTVGGQPEVLLVLTVYGAVTGFADIVERLEKGEFEFDLQTAMDLLNIAGALAAGIAPFITSVRGMGEMMLLGKTIGRMQIGIMVGMHSKNLIAAIGTGNWDKIYGALVNAAFDSALIAVTVAAEPHGAGTPGDEPAPSGAPGAEPPVPGGPSPGEEPGGGMGPSTAAGVGGKPPTRPPGQAEPTEPRTGSPQAVHEQWAKDLTEGGLAPRQVPQTPAGPEITQPGTYTTAAGETEFSTPEAAFRAYDEAVARAGGREVGVFRSLAKGESRYVVRVGTEHSVSGPGEGWESALHRHPNPDNVLTRRLPAPAGRPEHRARRVSYQPPDHGVHRLPTARRAPSARLLHGRACPGRGDHQVPAAQWRARHPHVQEHGGVRARVRRADDLRREGQPGLEVDDAGPRRLLRQPRARLGRVHRSRRRAARAGATGAAAGRGINHRAAGGLGTEGRRQGAAGPTRRRHTGPAGADRPGIPPCPPRRRRRLPRRCPSHSSGRSWSGCWSGPSSWPRRSFWLNVDPADFAREWYATGGRPPVPAGFTHKGQIWIQRGWDMTRVLFHEAVHQLARTHGAGGPFRERFGTFMEEGITDRLTRTHLGEWGGRHPYDEHVAFQKAMETTLGVTEDQIAAAYLDGDLDDLAAAIKRGFNGDETLTAWFIDALSKVDRGVGNRATLGEVRRMMYTERLP